MVGNDVVDLSDPDSSWDACHSRFDRRVFSAGELESLPAGHSDAQRRWILWSAKEAAYKAARRACAELAFSPAHFVVDLDASLRGSVAVGARRWPLRVRVDGDCVHAVVSCDERFDGILSGSRRLGPDGSRDPGRAVREFAMGSIAADLGVSARALRIEKIDRIPRLIVAGEAAPGALSLSHHGFYVGFAYGPATHASGLR